MHTPISHPPCRLYVGTSGYSYTEWAKAGFYPPDTPPAEMLGFYSRCFSITELNDTWYQLPRAETIERRRLKIPSHFLFATRVTRTLTHEIDPSRWSDMAICYRDGLAPLVQARQLAAVLIQLPPTFDRTPMYRKHLAELLDMLHGLPLAIEFHHRSWATDRVLAELERRRIALVTIDGPDLPNVFPVLDAVTNPDLIYVRFYGRNERGWRSGKPAARFDYDYSDDELHQWVDRRIGILSRHARRGILFFNNHVRAQAPENARRMIRILKEKGLSVA